MLSESLKKELSLLCSFLGGNFGSILRVLEFSSSYLLHAIVRIPGGEEKKIIMRRWNMDNIGRKKSKLWESTIVADEVKFVIRKNVFLVGIMTRNTGGGPQF